MYMLAKKKQNAKKGKNSYLAAKRKKTTPSFVRRELKHSAESFGFAKYLVN